MTSDCMGEPALTLRGFGVAFGERVVLSAVDLEIPDRHIVVLLGPAGTGKSTLLRTIAGFNAANPSLRTWGEALYAGASLGEGPSPALVSQSARLMLSSVLENIVQELPERDRLTQLQQRELACRLLEDAGLGELTDRLDEPVVQLPLATQRHLAIMRLAAGGPRLLCMDEPTSGLSQEEAHRLLEYIAEERFRRALLIVLHNQEHARILDGATALLAGGVIQEMNAADKFFSAPRTPAAQDFVRSGSCSVPTPDANPASLDPEAPPPEPVPRQAREYVSDAFGPRGFLWLKKGQLAGTPRPGIFFDIDYDLKALSRVGVTHLVTLTETPPDADSLANHTIGNSWSPIPDMGAPRLEQATDICQRVERLLAAGEVVAVHCRAGLGRTGTILAAYLIWEGQTALSALETVRRVEPRWVQSDAQVEFLERFAQLLKRRAATQFSSAQRSPTNPQNTRRKE